MQYIYAWGCYSMKKRFCLFLIIILVHVLILSAIPIFSQEGMSENDFSEEVGQISQETTARSGISVTAVHSVLIEAGSHSILYGNREHERAGMASTTKIMTALIVLKTLSLDTVVTIPKEAVGIEGSSIYLIEGERLTVEELLYGLLLESGNDCAVALAISVSGSVNAFVDKMNEIAIEMELDNTHFTNPHGLSDSVHFTSCYSLAIITSEALKNEKFREIVSTKQTYIPRDGQPNQRCLTNHNKLLYSYKGLIGVKTGYTMATGRCLVTAAERDGAILIAITFNDRNDWASHRNMLDYGFSKYESVVLAKQGSVCVTVPVTGGKEPIVNASNSEEAVVFIIKESTYTCEIVTSNFLYAPIKKGDTVGYAEYYNTNGVLFYRLQLSATQDIEIKRYSFFEKIFGG